MADPTSVPQGDCAACALELKPLEPPLEHQLVPFLQFHLNNERGTSCRCVVECVFVKVWVFGRFCLCTFARVDDPLYLFIFCLSELDSLYFFGF